MYRPIPSTTIADTCKSVYGSMLGQRRRPLLVQCRSIVFDAAQHLNRIGWLSRVWSDCHRGDARPSLFLLTIHALQITNRALLLAIRALLLIIRALLLTIHALLLTIRALLLTIHALLLTIHAYVFDMMSTFIAQTASRPHPVLPLLDCLGDLSGRSKQCDIGLRPINYNIFRWLLNRRVSEC